MKKSTILESLFALGAAFAASFALFAPGDAGAEMISALSCNVEHHDNVGDFITNASGIGNLSGNRARQLHCAVPPSWTSYANPISIDGFDGSNDPSGWVTGRICMMAYWGGAPDCGAPSRLTSNTESLSFSRVLDAIDTTAGNITRLHSSNYNGCYADLVIGMPAQGIYGASQIYGYYSH